MSYALNGLGQASKRRRHQWSGERYYPRRPTLADLIRQVAGKPRPQGYQASAGRPSRARRPEATRRLAPPVYSRYGVWGRARSRGLIPRGLKGLFGLGQDEEAPVDVSRLAPSPSGGMNVGMMLGWGSVIALTAGLFWAASRGTGTVAANPRRRRRRRRGYRLRRNRRASKRRSTRRRATSRRRRTRRASRRRATGALRRFKGLSAAARRRMPPSSFALPGKRFPVKGPPGSSAERNKWQAMQAIRYLNMGRVATKKDYLAIRNAIIRKYGAGFWRSYDGPTWNKVVAAKRRRGATRRRTSRRRATRRSSRRRSSRRGRRRVAANRRTSRRRSSRRGRRRRRSSRRRSSRRRHG